MEKSKLYFPLFVDLSDKKILVVGGGNIATRRVHTLVSFCQNICVVAPEVTKAMEKEPVTLCKRKFEKDDLEDMDIVLAATNDHKLNHEIYLLCKEKGLLVNTANNREECDFYFPGIVTDGAVVAGVTASGADHKRAKEVKEEIEAAFLKNRV